MSLLLQVSWISSTLKTDRNKMYKPFKNKISIQLMIARIMRYKKVNDKYKNWEMIILPRSICLASINPASF